MIFLFSCCWRCSCFFLLSSCCWYWSLILVARCRCLVFICSDLANFLFRVEICVLSGTICVLYSRLSVSACCSLRFWIASSHCLHNCWHRSVTSSRIFIELISLIVVWSGSLAAAVSTGFFFLCRLVSMLKGDAFRPGRWHKNPTLHFDFLTVPSSVR